MSGIKVEFSVLNQLATPAMHAAALANRPAAGQPGRVFIDTDSPSTGIYRDTGITWIQIAATSSPEADTLQTVTNRGNTTTQSITVGAATTPVSTVDVRRSTAALNNASDWALTGNNNPTITAGATFGVNYVNAIYGAQALTFAGSATIAQTGINAAGSFINTLASSGAGTITVTQGSGSVRAIAGVSGGVYFNTAAASTFTHVAGIKTIQPINSGGVAATVTNYYGVQIADSTPSSGLITYTNRYGIYQEGASDRNYFNGLTALTSGYLNIHNPGGSGYNCVISSDFAYDPFIKMTYGGGLDPYNPTRNSFLEVGSVFTSLYAPSTMSLYSASAERLRIFSNGNVSIASTVDSGEKFQVTGNIKVTGSANTIGSSAAVQTLDLIGSSALGTVTRYKDNITFRGAIGSETWVQGSALTGFSIYAYTGNDLYLYTGGAKRLTILDAGNVGIATATPAAKLHLNGTLRIDGQTAVAAGGSAGKHLIVNLDGTNYKIALLNV